MSTITLTLTDNTASYAFSGSVVYGTGGYVQRLNQFQIPLSDGTDVVYDGGPNIVKWELLVKNVSISEGLGLEAFLKDTLFFAKKTFSITGIPHINLGNGLGESVQGARYDGGASSQGLLALAPPGIYSVNFSYKFKEG